MNAEDLILDVMDLNTWEDPPPPRNPNRPKPARKSSGGAETKMVALASVVVAAPALAIAVSLLYVFLGHLG